MDIRGSLGSYPLALQDTAEDNTSRSQVLGALDLETVYSQCHLLQRDPRYDAPPLALCNSIRLLIQSAHNNPLQSNPTSFGSVNSDSPDSKKSIS